MRKTIESTVADAEKTIRDLALPQDQKIRIVIDDADESLIDIARRCREEAARNGMNEEIYKELIEDL